MSISFKHLVLATGLGLAVAFLAVKSDLLRRAPGAVPSAPTMEKKEQPDVSSLTFCVRTDGVFSMAKACFDANSLQKSQVRELSPLERFAEAVANVFRSKPNRFALGSSASVEPSSAAAPTVPASEAQAMPSKDQLCP